MSDVIHAENLTKRFGRKTAVDQLNLSVPAGAIFALLGDNGAGKSTTIRMLTGLLPPDSGRATVLEQDCWSAAVALRHRVGYVPEKPKFYEWMTVSEIGWFTAGFHKAGYFANFLELIMRYGLEPKNKLSSLSKGGYAKVGLALALASDPEVLILDEPTSGLDLFIRREFLASMVDLAGNGRTILISSHQIAEVERVASHVAFLAEGRLLLAAPLEELRNRFVRLQMQHEGAVPDFSGLGTLLEQSNGGRAVQVVLQDPNRAALDSLHHREDIGDIEESPLSLEEMYTSLLARYHRGSANGVARTSGLLLDAGHSSLSAAASSSKEGGRP